ncbi:hypothetical protein SAY86_016245 [Trapa natans]|uniref:Maternal effect embryo arrest protein n=1 Tax=Trapa natans TaxID=22666 RepID=A0AAN7L6I2_TRANT|nr:hypothetical protein SAY86_016245 [Trapa natans]
MSEQVPPLPLPPPPLPCNSQAEDEEWKVKYVELQAEHSKLKVNLRALRKGVRLYEQQILKVEAENIEIKKAYEQERARVEKEVKERESALRVSLESEISSFKAEISSLQQSLACASNQGNEKVNALEAKLSAGEREIKHLKDLLNKEKTKSDTEKKNAESEKRRANEAWKIIAGERSKVDEEKKIWGRENEENKLLVKALKKEADEIRHKLALETSKLIETNNKLQFERQQLIKERERAEVEKVRAHELREFAEVNEKKLVAEKCRTDNLSRQLEESSKVIEKLQKEIDLSKEMNDLPLANDKVLGSKMANKENNIYLDIPRTEACNAMHHQTAIEAAKPQLEAEKPKLFNERDKAEQKMRKAGKQTKIVKLYKKRALEEKLRAEQLHAQLNDVRQRNLELQQRREQTSMEQTGVQTGLYESRNYVDNAALNILKEQLKLQKITAKHAKEAADLERFRHEIALQEVQRLKLDFVQISHRLEMLDGYFLSSSGGTYEPKEDENTEMQSQRKKICSLQSSSSELMKPYMASVGDLTCRGSSIDFISGTNYELELPRGGPFRKKLKCTGINSALASVSDRGLVRSQDVGDINVSTPAGPLEDLLSRPTSVPSPMVGDNRITSGDNAPVVTENNVKSTLVIEDDGLGQRGQKRKCLIDVVGSVDSVCLKRQNLHTQKEKSTSSGMLMGQMESRVHDRGHIAENDPQTQQRFQSKINTHDENFCTENIYCDRPRKDQLSDIQAPLVACGQSSARVHSSILEEGEDQKGPFLDDSLEDFFPVDGDFMKLLELDNPADEQLYQLAFEGPLSPTLPEINTDDIKSTTFDMVKDIPQEVCCQVENLSTPVEVGFNNVEVDSSKLRFNFSKNEGAMLHNQQKNEHGFFPRYFIGSDMEDLKRISRIFCAIKSCIGQSSCISNPDWPLKSILVNLNMEENLPAKDKACTLLSILLLQFSVTRTWSMSLNKDAINCIDSLIGDIHNVMSDEESRNFLTQIGGIDELLNLIEDFLVDRKLIFAEISTEELITGDRRTSLLLEGVEVLVSSGTASANMLVAGSVVFAALCAASDQIGCIYEASYRIFCVCGSASSLVLIMLHIFAHISGGKYLATGSHSLFMSVLRSLVLFLKGSSNSQDSVCNFSHEEIAAKCTLCSQCPFSENALPLDVVMPSLLELLRSTFISGKVHNELVEYMSATEGRIPPDRDDKNSLMNDAELHQPLGVHLYSDLILLVELVAISLGWEWTKTKILPGLLKVLESYMQERSAAAVIILVGQLGRLGSDTSGCYDASVENLRCYLYSLFCQACSSKLAFPTHSAIAKALLSLLPLSFEEVLVNTATLPEAASINVPAQAIRRWFSCLSEGQKVQMCTYLRPTVTNGGRSSFSSV